MSIYGKKNMVNNLFHTNNCLKDAMKIISKVFLLGMLVSSSEPVISLYACNYIVHIGRLK